MNYEADGLGSPLRHFPQEVFHENQAERQLEKTWALEKGFRVCLPVSAYRSLHGLLTLLFIPFTTLF